MGRYIRKLGRIGHALGPSEERGFAMWVGYDIEGCERDLSAIGFVRVDGWSDAQFADYGVVAFTVVAEDDAELRAKLGLT